MREINSVIVHHSASSLTTTRDQIQQWHLDRGFSGIGYHWCIEGSGLLLAGRPWKDIGAHAKGSNRHSLGICLVGNNTQSGDEWREVQVLTLRRWWKSVQMFFPGIQLFGHRDVADTLCPGVEVQDLLKEG